MNYTDRMKPYDGHKHLWTWKINGDWAYGKCVICKTTTSAYIPFAEEFVHASMDDDSTN